MICLDKILFTDTTQLSDLKANSQNLTTINSKKEQSKELLNYYEEGAAVPRSR